MTSLTRASFGGHTYQGEFQINFFSNDQEGLSVTIDTERLHLRSVEAKEAEYDHYAGLFGDPKVMEKFSTGQTKTREEMKARINEVWIKRWRENDPYAGLAVFRNDVDDFLGHVVLGHGVLPGESELGYLFNQRHWGKGFGSEAVTAVVKEYAPATIQEGYLLDGKRLERITATARFDNPASSRILIKVGMSLVREEEKFGALRHHYSMKIG